MRRESLLKKANNDEEENHDRFYTFPACLFYSTVAEYTVNFYKQIMKLYIDENLFFYCLLLPPLFALDHQITNNVSYLKLYHVHTVSHRGVT
jgi:hypothetical protein